MDQRLIELGEKIIDASRKTAYDFMRNIPALWHDYLNAVLGFKRLASIETAIWLVNVFDMANVNSAVTITQNGDVLRQFIDELKDYLTELGEYQRSGR